MRRVQAPRLVWAVLAVIAATLGAVLPARADNMVITYSAAGVTAPDFSSNSTTGICYNTTVCDYGLENFSGWSGGSPYTSAFKDGGTGTYNQPTGVSFSGTYAVGANTNTSGTTDAWVHSAQNQYGGLNGNGYPELFGNGSTTAPANYTLSLSAGGVPGTNYFGIWISALDPYNDLKIFDGNTVIAEFNSTTLQAKLGNCASPSTNLYCGNPTTQFKGQDSGELFVYVNVFDLSNYITKVEFFDSGSTGFESTNHAVAYVNPIHVTGTVVQVPEPSTLALLVPTLLALGGLRRLDGYAPSVSRA